MKLPYYVRIASIYGFTAFMWIVVSDKILESLVGSSETAAYALMQSVKGLFFVFVTTALVFIVSRRYFHREQEERRRAETNEQLYRNLFERIPLPVLVCDTESSAILDVNAQACLQYGYTRDEFLRLPASALYTHSAEETKALLDRGVVESQHRTKNGTLMSVQVFSHQVPWSQPKTVRLLMVKDVSAQRKAEDELLRITNSVQSLVQERTQQLEEKNSSHKEILGIAAHDLRSPLTSVSLTAELLDKYHDRMSPAEQSRRLASIVQLTQRMHEMISDLLSYSELEGSSNNNNESVALVPLVAEVIAEFETQAQLKQIAVTSSLGNHEVSVQGNPIRLSRAVGNLISNAVKYGPIGSVVSVSLATTSTGFAVLQVVDQGSGIPEKEIPLLFKPFQKLTPKPTGNETSTGLGLSIVKKIAEACGGKIEYSNEEDGTCFRLSLPLANRNLQR